MVEPVVLLNFWGYMVFSVGCFYHGIMVIRGGSIIFGGEIVFVENKVVFGWRCVCCGSMR